MSINTMVYDLCFSKSNCYSDNYGSIFRRTKPQSYNDFIRDMISENKKNEPEFSQLIEVEVENKWFRNPRQLLTLDIDSPEALELAEFDLEHMGMGIQYYVVESSPSHYWVICAKVGKIKELIKLAKLIRGVDQQYIENAERQNTFLLRAFPKFIPDPYNPYTSAVKPQFHFEINNLTREPNTSKKDFTLFKHFLINFNNYWYNNLDMDRICLEIDRRYYDKLIVEAEKMKKNNPISKKVKQKEPEPKNKIFDDSILSQLEL